METRYIKIDKLIKKITKKDALFNGKYALDPYQNCMFECLYCDSSFDKIVLIKSNAPDILRKEIKDIEKGKIILGSVHDPYQNIEEKTGLTRELLKIIRDNNFGCHILTKSNLILRDIDILSKIKDCNVTISITSTDEEISKYFEENVPTPTERLSVVKHLNKNDIRSGVALIPILPHIIEEGIEDIIRTVKQYDAQYLVHKYLELKGDQKNYFFRLLNDFNPELVEKYEELYKNSFKPKDKYIEDLNNKVEELCKKYKLEKKV